MASNIDVLPVPFGARMMFAAGLKLKDTSFAKRLILEMRRVDSLVIGVILRRAQHQELCKFVGIAVHKNLLPLLNNGAHPRMVLDD